MNLKMVIETYEETKKRTQKNFSNNAKMQELQEQILKLAQLNLELLQHEEQLICYYDNKLDVMFNYIDEEGERNESVG